MDYLIYEEIPASSTSRQISPVDLIYRPKFDYRFSNYFGDRKAMIWRMVFWFRLSKRQVKEILTYVPNCQDEKGDFINIKSYIE